MFKWFTKADHTADIVVRWGGLYLVVTSLFSWLNSRLTWFSGLGWPEWIFIAIWMGLVAVFLVAAVLALIRYYRPLPASQSDPAPAATDKSSALRKRLRDAIIDPGQLYIAEVSIGTYKLEEEHWLEVAFRFFNATEKHLKVESAEGFIECGIVVKSSIPDDLRFKLPPPVLLRDRSNINDIPPFSEAMIVLQQHLPPKLMARVQGALEGDGLQFYFDDLGVLITGAHDRTAVVVLPITMGASLRQFSGLRTNRVHIARVGMAE